MTINELIEATARGDNRALIELGKIYNGTIKRFVRATAYRMGYEYLSMYVDDLYENPHLILYKAARRYSPEKGGFEKWVILCTANYTSNVLQKFIRQARHRSYTDITTLEEIMCEEHPL